MKSGNTVANNHFYFGTKDRRAAFGKRLSGACKTFLKTGFVQHMHARGKLYFTSYTEQLLAHSGRCSGKPLLSLKMRSFQMFVHDSRPSYGRMCTEQCGTRSAKIWCRMAWRWQTALMHAYRQLEQCPVKWERWKPCTKQAISSSLEREGWENVAENASYADRECRMLVPLRTFGRTGPLALHNMRCWKQECLKPGYKMLATDKKFGFASTPLGSPNTIHIQCRHYGHQSIIWISKSRFRNLWDKNFGFMKDTTGPGVPTSNKPESRYNKHLLWRAAKHH